MIDVAASVAIDHPVEEVFSFVQAEDNIPKWDTDLIRATKTSDGPVRRGTTFHLDIKPFMGETEGRGEVVAFEPNRLIELQFHMGRLNPHVSHLFEASANGTTFTRRVQIEPTGVLRLAQPMMRSMIRKRNARHIQTLKRLIEA